MRIKIDEQENLQEIVVTISCRKVDKEVSDIIKLLKMKNKTLSGIKENEVILVKVFEILYIESVDKKTFIYTKEDVFQCKEKLYELEEILEKESFIRISKNTIVNLNKVSKIVPDISRRLILTWIGLIIYVQIINVRFNKESKKYNKVLEEYKSKLKESNKTAMENKFMRSVIYINGEPNENLLTTDSIYSIFLKETNIEIYNRNPITMKVKKLKENIPFSEIDLIKISVGNIFRTRGTGFPLKFNYDGEEDRLYKLVYTLELEINLRSGEVRKINTNEIRDTFNYLINILKEKAINYEDTYNLEKLLKEKDDKELLKYFLKNEIGTDGLAGQYFKNIYRE